MADTRIYVVESKDGQPPALVEATSPSQALSFLARNLFEVHPASPKEVVQLMCIGVAVQVAVADQPKVAVPTGVNLPPGVLPGT